MRKGYVIIIMIAACLFLRALHAATLFDPRLRWQSLKTEHFWIHYHQGLEDIARRMAVISERTHARLTGETGWQPFLRTDLILVDNMDLANGFATPFPYNRVQIFINRADFDSVLGNFDDWLELVFTHEYVHILNLDMINGIPAVTRYTCGRVCFPNMFLPIWALEGNAVYAESRNHIYGRNNSTYVDMMMRMDVARDSLKGIAEASHYPRSWPMGNVPYIYGGRFIEYLEQRYGRDRFRDTMIENSDNILPYLVNRNAWMVYGVSFNYLWNEWQNFETAKFRGHLRQIQKEGVTPAQRITKSGYFTTLPRFAKDGKSLYYVRITGYSRPVLARSSLDGNDQSELSLVNEPNSLAVTGRGDLYLSDIEYYRSFSLYNEAFRYDSGMRRLTGRLRGRHIDVTADGSRSVCVHNDRDRYSLLVGDTGFQEFSTLIEKSPVQIAFPKISPDGKRIAFSFREGKGSSNLALIEVNSKKIERLTTGAFNDIHPTWHPDGTRLVFSSDRNGVYNLYELNLSAKKLARITNIEGGAFSPDISPDGSRIAFADYDAGGFNIALINYPSEPRDRAQIAPAVMDPGFFADTTALLPERADIPPSPYRIWRSILPPLWIPMLGSEEIYDNKYDTYLGLYTMGSDTLFFNQYSLMCFAYNEQKRAVVDFTYALSRFYPDFIVHYRDETLFYGEDGFPWADSNMTATRRTLEKQGSFGVSVPVNYYQSSHLFYLSYIYEKDRTSVYIPGYEVTEYTDILARLRFVYYYTNAQMYPFSISAEDGRTMYIISDYYSVNLGSDLSYRKVRGEYAEYLPGFASNNVIMLRLRGGGAFNAPDYIAPFNLGRFEKGKRGSVATDEDEFGMRGYPSGLIYGTRLAVATIEYRFPLFQVDWGYRTVPLMFRDLWLQVFAEYGNVWNGEADYGAFRSSAGAELHANITLGYYVALEGYIGFSRGFNESGENQVYFGIGTFYEGALKNRNKWFDFL